MTNKIRTRKEEETEMETMSRKSEKIKVLIFRVEYLDRTNCE